MVANNRNLRASLRSGRSWLRRWRSGFFCAFFLTGVLLQAGPHLQVRGNQYIVPPSLVSPGTQVRPAELIAKERRIQLLSALLSLGGAIGLARCYGKILLGGTRSDAGL